MTSAPTASPAGIGIWQRIGALTAVCLIAVSFAACEPGADIQQAQANAELRGIVASDRQQIDSLQDQVARLNDRIAEMEHNDQGDGAPSPDKTRLAELEREVQALRAGAPAPAAGAAQPDTTANPAAPGGAVATSGPSGASAPAAVSPMTATPAEAPPAAASPTQVANATGTSGAPGAAATAGAGPAANPDAAADDDSSDSGNDAPEVAANAPVAAAPAPAPGPALVGGSPSWRSLLGREMASAQSSSEAGAKAYRTGLVQMKEGRYAQAAAAFQAFQRKYPKSSFSEPAEYFSANALYELGKYDQSILQFNDLVMRFPRGRFASASLLNEAQAFMKMDDRIDARLTLQKLIGEHPNAAEAPAARAMINSLANG